MSFDIYLVNFTNQLPSGVARSIVLEAFGKYVAWEDEESGWTQYSSEDGSRVHLAAFKGDPNLISCVSINRPVADERFWNALHQIMSLSNTALFFPGGSGPLVANESVASHMPPDLGAPVIVSSGREILEHIQSS